MEQKIFASLRHLRCYSNGGHAIKMSIINCYSVISYRVDTKLICAIFYIWKNFIDEYQRARDTQHNTPTPQHTQQLPG